MRLWGGRFAEGNDERVADFTRSIEIDRELAADDLLGSLAHVRGLGRAGLLTGDEVTALVAGLEGLAEEVASGSLEWDPTLEDIHLNLEVALGERIGPLAGKLHTGRSRNDQVATDLRLWLRRAIDRLDVGLLAFERALVELAERDGTAVLPGTTHIQPAQPVLLAHHLLAYVEMAERDRARLADARRRVNVSPLGAGALAGAGYPLDREATARELGFEGITANSLDAVSDRDFVVEVLAAAALGMVHLSRLAEEVTWWSNPRFGFVRVADAFSTGSSMMPPACLRLTRWASCIAISNRPISCWMDADGVRITDFGLSGLADEFGRDEQSGTPAYMVPEQLNGSPATPQSDMYSLGLVSTGLHRQAAVRRAQCRGVDRSAPHPPLLHRHQRLALREIDPLAEKAILRCLSLEPRGRPDGPLEVLSSFIRRKPSGEGTGRRRNALSGDGGGCW